MWLVYGLLVIVDVVLLVFVECIGFILVMYLLFYVFLFIFFIVVVFYFVCKVGVDDFVKNLNLLVDFFCVKEDE